MKRTDQQYLANLLARIHRDGGHYQQEHGTEKACEDAHQIVAHLIGFVDEVATGRCWAGSPDCPDRMKDGWKRTQDWCLRCQAKYHVTARGAR